MCSPTYNDAYILSVSDTVSGKPNQCFPFKCRGQLAEYINVKTDRQSGFRISAVFVY